MVAVVVAVGVVVGVGVAVVVGVAVGVAVVIRKDTHGSISQSSRYANHALEFQSTRPAWGATIIAARESENDEDV